MALSTGKKNDRIFVRDGRRHYRKRYSVNESRIGIAILIVLASVLAWIAWKGAHPDPSLFMLETNLSQAGGAEAADRGPVPGQLAVSGWSEGEVSQFDYDNLYVKIDGREGYYKSFGFERLYFLSIVSNEDAQTAVDIELYDLGSPANAVGAYSGERSPGAKPTASESGLAHIDRNALYLTQGRYYLRAIGSEESPEIRAELEHLKNRFQTDLPGEPLPWGYALFVAHMGMEPGALSFAPENAYSFGFARDVYSAARDDDSELFVTPAGTETGARELAARFVDGFLQYGEMEGDFVKDRYLGTYSTATPAGPWVVGVYRATDVEESLETLRVLADAVSTLPVPETTADARPADNVEEEYEADEY
jgi:hypothetical protein